MNKINWKLAPEGAIGVAQRGQQLAFVDNDRNIFLDGHWGISMDWELVAKRPTFAESITKTPQLEQQKTVADAYEYHNGIWPNDDYGFLNFDSEEGWYCSIKGSIVSLVCTREQFKAYAKEQESKQESEKWTHEYNGDKCKIIHQADWQAWIKSKGGLSKLVPISELRKPKPTIKPSAAWSLVSEQGWAVHEVTETYDVEEVPAND